jgi:hypothetical protein
MQEITYLHLTSNGKGGANLIVDGNKIEGAISCIDIDGTRKPVEISVHKIRGISEDYAVYEDIEEELEIFLLK